MTGWILVPGTEGGGTVASWSVGKGVNLIMDGVIVANNKANYIADVTGTSGLDDIVKMMTANQRKYVSGFVKLLSNYEAEDVVANTIKADYPTIPGAKTGFSFRSGEITNNQLSGDGCLFTTSWAESYTLDKVTISNNNIYAEAPALTESYSNSQPEIYPILASRHGLFCLNSLGSLESVSSTQITASRLQISNNVGILVNLYPENWAQFYLMNSVFVNNTCRHSSMISLYDYGSIVSINNIFISNLNALGNTFAITGTPFTSAFGTYLKNKGIHASLLFLSDTREKASYEMVTKAFWNDVNPQYKLFQSGLLPQASLYFLDSSSLELNSVDFNENLAYSGIVNCFACVTSFISSKIRNSQVSGTSVVGNFVFLGKLILKKTKISNFSITRNSNIPAQQISAIVLFGSQLTIDDVEFTDGTIGSGTGLLFGNTIKGSINNLVLTRVQHLEEGNDGLIKFILSSMKVTSMTCRSVTSLLTLASSTVNLKAVSIEDLQSRSNKKFIIDMADTTLCIDNLRYQANSELGSLLSLITGDKDYIRITNSAFLGIPDEQDKLINLKNSNYFAITNTVFIYADGINQPTVLDLAAFKVAIIMKCTFKTSGKAIKASEALGPLALAANVIISNSNFEKLVIEGSKDTKLIRNSFVGASYVPENSLIQSAIQINDPGASVLILNNNFLSLSGLNGVLEIKAVMFPYNLNISHCNFINNAGSSGGALYLSADKFWTGNTLPYANIQDSVFLLNKAIDNKDNLGRGGAIFQTSPTHTKQITNIKRSRFFSNSAEKIGGAIYFDYTPPQIGADSKFKENYAKRLNHIASYPVRIVELDLAKPINITYEPQDKPLVFAQKSTVSDWIDIPSGPLADQVHYFAVLDMYNQVCYDDDSSILELYPEEFKGTLRNIFSNVVTTMAKEGLYVFENFKFTYRVGGTTKLVFESSAVKPFSVSPVDSLAFIPRTEVIASFRLCSLGEFVAKDDYSTNTCQRCQPSLWQLNPNSTGTSCQTCDEETTICLGGNDVGPRRGYWRLNKTADIMIKCPIEESCLGNVISGDAVNVKLDLTGKCAEGYTGNACFNCQAGWGKSSSGKCGKCSEEIWRYFIFFGAKIIAIFLIIQQIRSTTLLSKDFKNNTVKADMAVLMRILSNYLQLVSGISLININWPGGMGETLSNASAIQGAQDQTLAIECFFSRSGEGSENFTIYWNILIANITPFILVCFGLVFWGYQCFIKKKRGLKDFINKVVTTSIILFYNMQPETITKTFKLFQCKNLYRKDNPESYLMNNYDMKCWEGVHLHWALSLGIPSIIIWIFVFPLISFFILRRNKFKLETEKISRKYAFLYVGYRQEKYYWEFLIITRKILLIFSAVIGSLHSITLQIYLSVVLTIVAYILHINHHPYAEAHFNRLETVSLLSSEIVSIYGLYFQVIKRDVALDVILGLLSIVGVICFFGLFIKQYFKMKLLNLLRNERAIKVIEWVGKKLCCCINFQSIFEKLGVRAIIELSKIQTYGNQSPRLLNLQSIASFPESPFAKTHLLVETQKSIASQVFSPLATPLTMNSPELPANAESIENVPEEKDHKDLKFVMKPDLYATFSGGCLEEQKMEAQIQKKETEINRRGSHKEDEASRDTSRVINNEQEMSLSPRMRYYEQNVNSSRLGNENISSSRIGTIDMNVNTSRLILNKKENSETKDML